MEGRRHSVDVPISKALIALRRVRSLRDPSTNSMSKFSALIDNVNWETNSYNGISLQFMNGSHGQGSINNDASGHCKEDNDVDGFNSSNGKFGWISSACEPTGFKPPDDFHVQKQEDGLKMMKEKCGDDHRNNGLELACATPSINSMEGADSCSESMPGSYQMNNVKCSTSEQKRQIRNRRASGYVGDLASRVGSPKLDRGSALFGGSSCSTPLFVDDEVDGTDCNDVGCTISCCWSGTPKLRGLNPFSEVEDGPLLTGDANEMNRLGWRKAWRYNKDDSLSYPDTPRSVEQKFKLKSFSELVGQNVVARSLLGAVARGKISSIYLFHGPRGTGKTSASRLFAAALNCLTPKEHGPCGICKECMCFFSGRSRDVREVDAVGMSRTDRVKSLIKFAATPPASSRFKVLIIDECQLLPEEAWAILLSSLENLPQHVVFVVITPNIDKLPRSAVSHSHRYHFPKIKDADVARRLGDICAEECLEFDQAALEFIAAKSNGSLRDAEMMLDQLGLLGKRITISLVYELIGTVSDDELLELLNLALSSDTSKTVIRARELMKSRIDPMQLVSQLANVIMDVLSGKQEVDSEAWRNFCRSHSSEADLHKLRHALKILSETEKQLRISKNQTTWLTAALLQLSSIDSSSLDEHELKCCSRNIDDKDADGDRCSRSSTGESKKCSLLCSCDAKKTSDLKAEEDHGVILDSIWKRAIDLCQSSSLKSFLRKQGRLFSLCLIEGRAVVELGFSHSDHVAKAEKSWKSIASSLQSIVGRNVEVRIGLLPCEAITKSMKFKRLSFSLFSCSGRMQQTTRSSSRYGSDSDYSDYFSEKVKTEDKPDTENQMLHICYNQVGTVSTLRNGDGNILRVDTISPRSSYDYRQQTPVLECSCCRGEVNYYPNHLVSIEEPGVKLNCFSRILGAQKKFSLSSNPQIMDLAMQENDRGSLSIPGRLSSDSTSVEPFIFRSCSDVCTPGLRDKDELVNNSEVLCWRTPSLPVRQRWRARHARGNSHLVDWVLPCAAAK